VRLLLLLPRPIKSYYIVTDTVVCKKIRIQDCVTRKMKKKGEDSPMPTQYSKSSADNPSMMMSLLYSTVLAVYHLQGEVTMGWVILSSPIWYYEFPRVVSRLSTRVSRAASPTSQQVDLKIAGSHAASLFCISGIFVRRQR